MANRTTHRRMLATPEPEPKASMDLPTLKKQTKPSTSHHLSINLDPPMAVKPSHRQRPNRQQFMSASAIMDYSSNSKSSLKPNPQPKSVSAVPNIQKQSKPTKELAWKDKPNKPTEDMDNKKIEEVLEKKKKKKKEEDEFDGRRLSVTMAVTANGGRRSSLSGSQVQLADVFASNGVKMVSADMPPFMQIHAVECARKTHDSLEKFTSKTLALTLKREFDGVYGPAWHCIVGTSFGSFVTHSVSGFLYFSMDQKLHILLFKTTVQRAD